LIGKIYFGDNLPILETLASESIDLIYIDPPFNTGRTQGRTQIQTTRSENGDRTGFQDQRYQTIRLGTFGERRSHRLPGSALPDHPPGDAPISRLVR
jgi:DNA modification methylase